MAHVTKRKLIAKKSRGKEDVATPRFRLLLDTCVWLDLAKDREQQPFISAIQQLVIEGEVQLLVPRIILDEFARNKERIIAEGTRSLTSTLKRAREVVGKLAAPNRKTAALQQIDDVSQKLPTLGERAVESVAQIENLFKTSRLIDISDSIRIRAAQRAIESKAPFHGHKNSMADAIIIESYAEEVITRNSPGTRFVFVTHNFKDFSDTTSDNRQPHPDLDGCFSKIKSQYFISLGDAIKRIAPGLLSEHKLEDSYGEELRAASEIIEAADRLTDQIWYDRHQGLRQRVTSGKTKIVDREPGPFKYDSNQIVRDVWEGALKGAARVEKRIGKDNLGPWSEFDWGMLNGKLSALRWILGEDWDMLDT